MLRVAAEFGPQPAWFLIFAAAVIGAFVIYIGIAMIAVLYARDEEEGKLRYQLFHDLISLFRIRVRR
jgi:hypothetical protein